MHRKTMHGPIAHPISMHKVSLCSIFKCASDGMRATLYTARKNDVFFWVGVRRVPPFGRCRGTTDPACMYIMLGTKGCSGGYRPGAGRPAGATAIKKRARARPRRRRSLTLSRARLASTSSKRLSWRTQRQSLLPLRAYGRPVLKPGAGLGRCFSGMLDAGFFAPGSHSGLCAACAMWTAITSALSGRSTLARERRSERIVVAVGRCRRSGWAGRPAGGQD